MGAARLVACSSSDSVVPEREAPNPDRTLKSADLSTAVGITCARSRVSIGLSHTVRIRWDGARRCRRCIEDSRILVPLLGILDTRYSCTKYTQTPACSGGGSAAGGASELSEPPSTCPATVNCRVVQAQLLAGRQVTLVSDTSESKRPPCEQPRREA